MIFALIGHRGTGKTSLLKRLRQYHPGAVIYDLDLAVERHTQLSVAQIFDRQGEAAFRQWEAEVFRKLYEQHQESNEDVYMALGAGFQFDLPLDVQVIWVRRPTDLTGRVFLDRPPLNQQLSRHDEYLKRFPGRQDNYLQLADETLTLMEGMRRPNAAEALFFNSETNLSLGGGLTILPEVFAKPHRFKNWIEKRLRWGVDFFELRTDLLSLAQIFEACQVIPKTCRLVSVRAGTVAEVEEMPVALWAEDLDWPLELGLPMDVVTPKILSLHEKKENESIYQAGKRLEQAASHVLARSHQDGDSPSRQIHLKLAVMVDNFADLQSGHEWWQEDPGSRSFLPRSEDGRWSWYRQIQKGRMRVNFWREGDGSALDQPHFMEWALTPMNVCAFAAVLGDPVTHSWTPAYHRDYFTNQQAAVVRLRMGESELNGESLDFLFALGLRWAAVTSPIKEKAFTHCCAQDDSAQNLNAVNTLKWQEKRGWLGCNTDLHGLQELLKDAQGPIAVWGGGGTRAALRQVLPAALMYSVRTGHVVLPASWSDERKNNLLIAAESFRPTTVVWAVNRQRLVHWPPLHWQPQQVIDLNYNEDSPGREYALTVSASYQSGEAMFVSQADEQQKFWR